MVVTMTPDQVGEYGVICNEYCGIGHHTMLGKMYVKENY
jgi:cytochrome c oxidase subunit 2